MPPPRESDRFEPCGTCDEHVHSWEPGSFKCPQCTLNFHEECAFQQCDSVDNISCNSCLNKQS